MEHAFNTDVLIVGAGPTGLMMACQLSLHNIPFRIIDKNEDHTTQSRALVVQARSVEIFEQMGIADKAIQQGKIAKAIGAFFNGKKVLRVTVNNMGEGLTQFPFLLMLEQSRTEAMLVDFLRTHHHAVERKVELTHIEQSNDEVISILRKPGGEEETVRSKFVVGADGAHSIVRERLEIPFGGKTYDESLFVMDCKAVVDIPDDEMYLTFADQAVGGFFPLTNGRWRILGNIPKELEGKEHIEFEDIERHYADRIHLPVKLYDPHWVTVYRAHHRYAATFRKGRCFLTGDAAHIHSPVGAQGMNTGLQDAYNLAWKLVLVLAGKARPTLLDTYTEERITIARKLVRTTDRAFNLVTSERFLLRTFRFYIMPVALPFIGPIFQKLKFVQRIAFRLISEIGINYRHGSLTENASLGKFPGHAPKPGDRLPYIRFTGVDGNETSTHEMVKGSFFQFFFFADDTPKAYNTIIQAHHTFFSHTTIIPSEQTKDLYKKLGVGVNSCVLVRPDRYVAYRADKFDAEHVKNYLAAFLID